MASSTEHDWVVDDSEDESHYESLAKPGLLGQPSSISEFTARDTSDITARSSIVTSFTTNVVTSAAKTSAVDSPVTTIAANSVSQSSACVSSVPKKHRPRPRPAYKGAAALTTSIESDIASSVGLNSAPVDQPELSSVYSSDIAERAKMRTRNTRSTTVGSEHKGKMRERGSAEVLIVLSSDDERTNLPVKHTTVSKALSSSTSNKRPKAVASAASAIVAHDLPGPARMSHISPPRLSYTGSHRAMLPPSDPPASSSTAPTIASLNLDMDMDVDSHQDLSIGMAKDTPPSSPFAFKRKKRKYARDNGEEDELMQVDGDRTRGEKHWIVVGPQATLSTASDMHGVNEKSNTKKPRERKGKAKEPKEKAVRKKKAQGDKSGVAGAQNGALDDSSKAPVFKSKEFVEESDDDLALVPGASFSAAGSVPASVLGSVQASVLPFASSSIRASVPSSVHPSIALSAAPSISESVPPSPPAITPMQNTQSHADLNAGSSSRDTKNKAKVDGKKKKKTNETAKKGKQKAKEKTSSGEIGAAGDFGSDDELSNMGGGRTKRVSDAMDRKRQKRKGTVVSSEEEDPPGQFVDIDGKLEEAKMPAPGKERGQKKTGLGQIANDSNALLQEPVGAGDNARADGEGGAEKENVSSIKSPQQPARAPVAMPKARHTLLHAIPRKGSISDLLRRVNSRPDTPCAAASPASSPSYFKATRTALARIAPLHPHRRTPPPPLPRPPPPKKTKKQLEMEERWEMELAESVDGWVCMTEAERTALFRAKRDAELGYED